MRCRSIRLWGKTLCRFLCWGGVLRGCGRNCRMWFAFFDGELRELVGVGKLLLPCGRGNMLSVI